MGQAEPDEGQIQDMFKTKHSGLLDRPSHARPGPGLERRGLRMGFRLPRGPFSISLTLYAPAANTNRQVAINPASEMAADTPVTGEADSEVLYARQQNRIEGVQHNIAGFKRKAGL